MSIKLMSWAWELDISHTEKLVLICLTDFASDEGVCFPSIKTIARKCSLTERGVFKVVARLESLGFVERQQRDGRSSVFIVKTTEHKDAITHERHSPTPEPCSPPPEPYSPITITYPSNNNNNNPPYNPPLKGSDSRSPNGSLEFLQKEKEDSSLKTEKDGNRKERKLLTDENFNSFWEAYPRKVAKIAARKAFEKAVKVERPEAIIEAARAFARQAKEDGTVEKYIPYPATWINQGRFLDFGAVAKNDTASIESASQMTPAAKKLAAAGVPSEIAAKMAEHFEIHDNRLIFHSKTMFSLAKTQYEAAFWRAFPETEIILHVEGGK